MVVFSYVEVFVFVFFEEVEVLCWWVDVYEKDIIVYFERFIKKLGYVM